MRSGAVTSSSNVAVAHRRRQLGHIDGDGREGPTAAQLVEFERQRVGGIGWSHEHHVARHGAAAGPMSSRGHDRLPEHLAPLDDSPEVAAPRQAAIPAVTVRRDVEDVHQLRGVPPGGESLHRHTARIVFPHGVKDLDDDPVVIEGGEALSPPMCCRCTGERPQDAATVRAVHPVSPSTDVPSCAHVVAKRGGAVHLGPLERCEPHVLEWKVERRGLARPIDPQRGRGLGDELARPPGPGHQRAGSSLRGVTGTGCGPGGYGLGWVGQRRSRGSIVREYWAAVTGDPGGPLRFRPAYDEQVLAPLRDDAAERSGFSPATGRRRSDAVH